MRVSRPVEGTAEYPLRSSSPTGLARTGSSDSATDGSGRPATTTPEGAHRAQRAAASVVAREVLNPRSGRKVQLVQNTVRQ
jgi:hypothetical protein